MILSCPFNHRTLKIETLLKREEFLLDDSYLPTKQLLVELPSISIFKIARFISFESVKSKTSESSSAMRDSLRSYAAELRTAILNNRPLQPSIAHPVLLYASSSATSPCCKSFFSFKFINNPQKSQNNYIRDFYDSEIEVQAWVDCCFFDWHRTDGQGNSVLEESRLAFESRVRPSISCEDSFLSDVLLCLRGDCFSFHITRCYSTKNPNMLPNADLTYFKSSSANIPLDYLHKPAEDIRTIGHAQRTLESLSIFELFDLYRKEAVALVHFRSQLLALRPSVCTAVRHADTSIPTLNNAAPNGVDNTVPQESLRDLRITTEDGSYTAVYDALPYPTEGPLQCLPVTKVSAVFADRTILHWDLRQTQVRREAFS